MRQIGRSFSFAMISHEESLFHILFLPHAATLLCLPSCWRPFKACVCTRVSTCAGLKPYVCSMCDYAGRSRNNLKTHMNRHNTERRHLCDLCGKKFKSKVTLKSHRLSHTDEGTYTLLCHWWCLFWLCTLHHQNADRNLQKCKVMINNSKSCYFVFVQGSGFNVQSATSPQSRNLPCSDTWSNTLSSR